MAKGGAAQRPCSRFERLTLNTSGFAGVILYLRSESGSDVAPCRYNTGALDFIPKTGQINFLPNSQRNSYGMKQEAWCKREERRQERGAGRFYHVLKLRVHVSF